MFKRAPVLKVTPLPPKYIATLEVCLLQASRGIRQYTQMASRAWRKKKYVPWNIKYFEARANNLLLHEGMQIEFVWARLSEESSSQLLMLVRINVTGIVYYF